MSCAICDIDARGKTIEVLKRENDRLGALAADLQNRLNSPVPMRLNCPECGELHIDEGEFATKAHHSHACQHCGAVWRPAIVNTVGVKFLPGFKNDAK